MRYRSGCWRLGFQVNRVPFPVVPQELSAAATPSIKARQGVTAYSCTSPDRLDARRTLYRTFVGLTAWPPTWGAVLQIRDSSVAIGHRSCPADVPAIYLWFVDVACRYLVGAQVCKYSEHTAVVVPGRGEVKPVEDAAHVRLDGFGAKEQPFGDGLVRAPLGHEREYLAFPIG